MNLIKMSLILLLSNNRLLLSLPSLSLPSLHSLCWAKKQIDTKINRRIKVPLHSFFSSSLPNLSFTPLFFIFSLSSFLPFSLNDPYTFFSLSHLVLSLHFISSFYLFNSSLQFISSFYLFTLSLHFISSYSYRLRVNWTISERTYTCWGEVSP